MTNPQIGNMLLGSIELFCLSAEHGSFTRAAMHAGLTPAAVSRSISRLEERLNVRLFSRNTRSIQLTTSGRAFLQHCRSALDQLREAEREIGGHQAEASGKIRLSVPTTYGHHRVLPLIGEFLAQHPKVQIDIHVGNRNVDLISDEFDLAIRARTPPDSSLIARHLEDAELVVVGAPLYFARHGRPNTLADLNKHKCINFILPSTGRPSPWLFKSDGVIQNVVERSNYSVMDDVLAGITLAKSGVGLFQTMAFTVTEDLQSGVLETVLDDYSGCTRPFYLLYPQSRHIPRRVRLLIDFLVAIAPENKKGLDVFV